MEQLIPTTSMAAKQRDQPRQEQGPQPLPWEENMHIALCPASLDLLLLEEYPVAIYRGALRAAMLR